MNSAAAPLVPGVLRAPNGPLARYRSPQVAETLRAVLVSATQPGDAVLELGAQDSTYLRETVELGRRMLALNVNPLTLLWIEQELRPAPVQDLQVAVTRLADQPKDGQPFSAYVQSLYRSRCPACNRPGIAEWFAWDREAKRPFAKKVRCTHCETQTEGPVTADDISLSRSIPPQSGPAYYYALGKVAQSDDPLRERASELVGLYTPRTLSILMDILHRVTQIGLTSHTRDALMSVLLDVFDRSSSLNSYDEQTTRPRSLRPAQRYLEWNIWSLVELALADYWQPVGVNSPQIEPCSLQAFIGSSTIPYLLLNQPLHAVAQQCPPQSLAAAVIHPEVPDATLWALSALWSAWLGKGANLRAFLGRRRLDWEWYKRSLGIALRQVATMLRPGAPLVCVIASENLLVLETVLEAVDSATMEVERWIACYKDGFRLLLSTTRKQPAPVSELSEEAFFRAVLSQRGEPTPQPILESAAVMSGDYESAPRISPTMTGLQILPSAASPTLQLIWLARPDATGLQRPLGDRVEEAVIQLLKRQTTWQRLALESQVHTQFGGALSPEPQLVRACVQAYTQPVAGLEDEIVLRPEDQESAREHEIHQLRLQVEALGNQLGLDVDILADHDLVWSFRGESLYQFRFSVTACLSRHLLAPSLQAIGRRCLVIPGGRAALVDLKLRRDPRLQDSAARQHWTFVKFRHLRRMLAEVKQRSEIEVYLGLDPIVEQGQAQIPLPLT